MCGNPFFFFFFYTKLKIKIDWDWGWVGEAACEGRRPLANHRQLCHILMCLRKSEVTGHWPFHCLFLLLAICSSHLPPAHRPLPAKRRTLLTLLCFTDLYWSSWWRRKSLYALGVSFNKDPRVQVHGINLAGFLKLGLVKVYFFDVMLLRKEVWESRVCGSFPLEDVAIKILDHLIPVMKLTLKKRDFCA